MSKEKEKDETQKLTKEEREKKAIEDILKKKRNAESYVASVIYLRPEYLYEEKLDPEIFSSNMWKVYYIIASDIVLKEKKKKLDDITVGLYLENHKHLKEKYLDYGGYHTILTAKGYMSPENYDGFLKDLKKWHCVLNLADRGFPIADKMSEFADLNAEEIFRKYETELAHVFTQSDEIKSYNPFEGMDDFIQRCNECQSVGLPLHNAEILTSEIGGIKLGNIYGLGAGSGVGKSTLAFNWLVPSAIRNEQKILFIINEEDVDKFRQELLIWVVNNEVRKNEKPITKKVLRDGQFPPDILESFKKANEWIEKRKDDNLFTVIPLDHYTAGKAIRIINKYSAMGVKYFVLDTLKESDGAKGEIYNSMTRDMVSLYDTVKPQCKNVALFVTYQLGKAALKMRHLTNNEIGQAKSILDVMSVNLMIRRPLEDEYDEGKKALHCYKLGDMYKDTNEKVQYKLEKIKRPMLTFICKNRFGETDVKQVVSECDLGTNICKDVAVTVVPQDW